MAESESTGGEFEREPVPESHLLGPGKFWGMYAGEHCAGTEFMIGPLFLAAGASLQDIFFGLLLGNALAVLTWRYLVTPIATRKRMTLYYQLERIAGGGVVKFYNAVNGVLFCFLAGAMITVSASAVGVPFDVIFSVPKDNVFGLAEPTFTVLCLLVGAVITLVAAGGYETVSKMANIAAPWMIAVFAACGLVSIGQLGVSGWEDLTQKWETAIEFVQTRNGPGTLTFWQIVVFAWLCNGAMHFGMADLSIFRFAKRPVAGWAPAIGMFLGHYLAWISAGLLLAAQMQVNSGAFPADEKVTVNPGLLTWATMGWAGILCVVIAGWTTANPTIYRAGLAFQGIAPGMSRVTATVLAGVIATAASVFPSLSGMLLGFVGTYGTVLGPMGAVLFVDFWLMKRYGLTDEYAARTGSAVSLPVLIAWLLPVTVGLYLIFWQGVFAAYCVVPAWVACGVIYLALSKAMQKPQPAIDHLAS